MLRKLSFSLRTVLIMALASSLYMACGGGGTECKSTNDCKSKGSGYVCKPDAKTGKNTCVKKSTNNNNSTTNSNGANSNTNSNKNNGNGNGNGNTTPKPDCAKDTDCRATEVCEGGKCKAKPECKSDVDCAGKAPKTKCTNNKCVNPGTSTKCTSDSDCPGGQTCNTTTGACSGTTGTKKDIGEVCSQTDQCKTGLACITAGGKSHCFENCANGGKCRAGTTCIQATATISICAKQAKTGEACSFAGKDTQALCSLSQTAPEYCSPRTNKCVKYIVQKTEGAACGDNTKDPVAICDRQSALACVEKKCKKLKDSDELGPCNGTTGFQCKQGANLTCTNTSQNSGHCFKGCKTASPTCSAGQNCRALQQGGADGVCLPTGTLDYGAACGVGAKDKYDPAKLCKSTFSCVNFGRSVCVELSQGKCASYQCKTSGATCVDLTAGSTTYAGCFKKCTSNKDCTGATFCRDLGASGKVCWPKNPPGDVPYGEACKRTNPTQATRCKEPNTCIGTNAEAGFCGKGSCTTDTDCPAYTGGGANIKASCVAAGSGKLCVFACTKTGDPCPKGLSCIDLAGSKICAPKPPTGPNQFMGKCNSQKPITTDGCVAGYGCTATNSTTGDGFCTKGCSSNTDCGKAGSIQATCVKGLLRDPNAGLCVVGCGQPGQTCPTGLSCRSFGQNSICAP